MRPNRALVRVELELAPATLARARSDAATCGLGLDRWLAELVEVRVAEGRCEHDPAPVAVALEDAD